MARSFPLLNDVATQSARLRLALRYIQIIAVGMGLLDMSHELRTPLNSIINFARILSSGMRGPVTAEQRDYLNRVRQSGEHLLGLINDILDLSKIESGRMELYTEPVHVVALIRDAMASAAGLTKGKAIALRQELDAALPPVDADPTRLRQIVLNLLSNAAKFTTSGAITVRARREGDQLLLSVSDTGIGIAPEHLAVIFEEFRQIEGTASRRYEGTGLGLAICRKLVELHGGRLWVESVAGVGSTFTFTLPVATRALPSATSATLASASSTGVVVLVVDDDPTAIEIVAAYLEHDGYAVYGLTNSRRVLEEARLIRPAAIILDVLMPHKDGWAVLAELKADALLQAGLAQVAAAVPDLIILDLVMPEVDGFAVLHALDRQATTRAIPVIVLTAKEVSVSERAYLHQRVHGLLQKGATPPEQLLSRVSALVRASVHSVTPAV